MTTAQWVTLGWTAVGGVIGMAVFVAISLLRERRARR